MSAPQGAPLRIHCAAFGLTARTRTQLTLLDSVAYTELFDCFIMLLTCVNIARTRELGIDCCLGAKESSNGGVARKSCSRGARAFSRPLLPTRRLSSSPSSPPPNDNIEIEAKFFFTQADAERIAAHPEVKLVKTKTFTDVYFDSPARGFPLTTRDIWLRQRSGNWEVKVPIGYYTHSRTSFGPKGKEEGRDRKNSSRSTNTDSYVEIEAENDILRFLRERRLLNNDTLPLQKGESLEVSLRANGFEPCATITTHRSSYLHRDVGIDLDRAEPLNYRVGELEVMVTGDSQASARQDALHKIQAVANCHHLDIRNGMRGKVLEHLRVFSPKHYQALDDCGLLESKGINKNPGDPGSQQH